MVDVTLPESRPEDDEDVVWGLSTAAALWARGEHGDAIVWLRRAADAASAAGQDGRAAELGMSAVRAEQALERLLRQTMPPPGGGGADRPSLGIDVEIEPASLKPSLIGPSQDGSASGPKPRPPAELSPLSAGLLRSPEPPAMARPGTIRPPAPPRVTPLSVAPPAGPPAPPVTAASNAPSLASPVPPPTLPPAPPAVPNPMAAPRAPAPSSYPGARRTSGPRVPILDPWAEEPTLPSLRAEPVIQVAQIEGDEVMVQMRRSSTQVIEIEEDDGVVTSAAPLDHTLHRVSRPTPPARKWTATGEQPPGHIADASVGVASKVPAGKPRPPAPPPVAPPAEPATPSAVAPPPSTTRLPPVVPAKVPAAPAPPPPAPTQAAPTTPPSASSPPAPPRTLDPNDVPTLPTQASPIPRPRAITIAPPAASPARPAVSVPLPSSPVRAPAAPRASVRPPGHDGAAPKPPAPHPIAAPAAKSVRPLAAAPPPAPAHPAPRASVLDAAALESVEALSDVPLEARAQLALLARVEVLGADEEVSAFGAALLVEGAASICATIVDEPASRAVPGTLVPTRGTLTEAVALRVVAGPAGARVALWDQAAIEEALRASGRVLDELRARADRLQALAGATMGPLGELDEPTRDRVLGRLVVRVARAGEVVEDASAALVCVGSVEVSEAGKPAVVRAGEVLFPRADAHVAKAGVQGAILLVGDAEVAAELAAGPPSLAALFTPR
jgi:hypothetical protein